MAASATIATQRAALLRIPNQSKIPASSNSFPNSITFRFSGSNLSCRKPLSIRSTSFQAAAPAAAAPSPGISLTEKALKHLNKMRTDRKEDLYLRIGVKQGGCSGMSYTMEFEDPANARPDDSLIEYDGFVIVKASLVPECNPFRFLRGI